MGKDDSVLKAFPSFGNNEVRRANNLSESTIDAPSANSSKAQALPKQTSTDQKPTQPPTELKPAKASTVHKSKKMPRDEAYSEDERRPRKVKQVATSESEDSDSEDAKQTKQIVRREVTKEVSKRGKSKAKPKRRRDDSDSEEEVIVTRTVRKKTLDFDDLDEGYIELLCDVFGVQPIRVQGWCEKDRIKWDNKENEYSIEKILADEDEKHCKDYEKQYKRHKKMWQRPSEKEDRGGPSSGILIDNRPMRSMGGYGFDPTCLDCRVYGSFCGDPRHNRYY